ncbi:MAG: hypothetical protein AAFZ91_01315 [Pseudomonadota bacterium]
MFVRSFCLALLSCLLSPIVAADNDPFAVLFGDGDGPLSASATEQAGRDDLSIITLRLDGFKLIDALPGFETEAGLCLPVQPVIDALEFPIQLDGGAASGWFVSPERKVQIDFETGETHVAGRQLDRSLITYENTDEGWCAPLPTLIEIFDFDMAYRSRELTVEITPREILPIEARLEREAARRELDRENSPLGPSYDPVDNPYRWISLPVADIAVTSGLSSTGKIDTSLSIDAAGDLLKMTGRLRTVSSESRMIDGVRLSLERQDLAVDRISPIKARRYAIGDISTPALPLLSRGQTGAGAVFSNRADLNADIFDTTEIRGVLPEGWEAELYAEDRLIAFVTDPDPNGEYVFDTVALRPGYNRLQVRLFGPYGETDTRDIRYFVGSDLTPENETAFSIGFVNGNQSLLGDRVERGSSDLTLQETEAQPQAFATVSHGISDRATLRLDALLSGASESDEPSGATASVFGTVFDTYGAVRISSTEGDTPAVRVSAQRQIGAVSGLSAGYTDFGDTENTVSGLEGSRVERSATARLTSQLQLAGRVVPTQAEVSWQDLTGDISRFDAKLRASGAIGRYRWTNSLRHRSETGPEQSVSQTDGEWLATRDVNGVRMRAAIGYSLEDTLEPTSLSVGAQRVFENRSTAQVSLSHDLREQTSVANAAWSRRFRNVILTGNASLRENGDWSCGVGLSLSLFRDQTTGHIAVSQPGLSRSGAVRQTVFHDLNGNGLREAEEPAIEGVQFIVGNSLRPEATGKNGQVMFDGVPAGLPINVELRLSSLNDPFLKPLRVGRSVTVRAGQVVDILTPVQSTGDIEGVLLLQNGEVQAPISGVEIEFRDKNGHLMATTRTEFDGYFYADGLAMGEITVKIADKALTKTGMMAAPLVLSISPQSPSVFGAQLLIEPQPDESETVAVKKRKSE